jgi:hypothetical protein
MKLSIQSITIDNKERKKQSDKVGVEEKRSFAGPSPLYMKFF